MLTPLGFAIVTMLVVLSNQAVLRLGADTASLPLKTPAERQAQTV